MSDQLKPDIALEVNLGISVSITFTSDPYIVLQEIIESMPKPETFEETEEIVIEDKNTARFLSQVFETIDLLGNAGLIVHGPFASTNEVGESTYKFSSGFPDHEGWEEEDRTLNVQEIIPFLPEFGRFVVQLSGEISQGIAQNKSTLEILASIANIIQVIIPLARISYQIRKLVKEKDYGRNTIWN